MIDIGDYQLRGGVNEVNIKKSVNTIVDTANIKIPALGRALNNDTLPASSVETAGLFKEGQKVKIQLGYNYRYRTEFEGFVRRVNLSTPVNIELEGYAWQLRKKTVAASWRSVTIKQVLEKIVEGTDIVLSDKIPDSDLIKITLKPMTGLQALEYVKEKLLMVVHFDGNVLYAGLEEGIKKGDVQYRLGWNVIRDDQLKYRIADDTLVRVRIVLKLQKGEQVLYEAGDKNGEIVKKEADHWGKPESFVKIAKRVLSEKKFTGFEGKITAFLEPFCQPTYTAEIIDKKYGKRDGKYFVAGTEVKFGTGGARRIVEITRRLSV
ncbi:MAG: hypothetical protein H7289_07870 [Mucilaginibacter sp.]|nr:hypothetical protein [Mucilaginibacter sp.]